MDAGVHITIWRSKIDQWQKGVCLTLGACADRGLCLVAAVCTYIKHRGSDEGVFLQHKDGNPLTKYQFWALAQRALDALGLVGVQFGIHSFQFGAGSTVALMGYPEAAMKCIGRWRSAAYKSYVHKCRL